MLWKVPLLLIVMLCVIMSGLFAQSNDRSIVRIARKDAFKNFNLNESDFKRFRLNRRDNSGDYFNPEISTVSNPEFLSDSVYVQAFRHFAYLKTRSRHTLGHYCLLGGATLVVGLGITAIMLSTINFDFLGSTAK